MYASRMPPTIMSWLSDVIAPPLLRGRDLGEVERHDHRGSADGEAEDDPRRNEDAHGRCERGEERADREDGGRDHDQQPAAESIG